jgi:hypothetical protein
MSAPDHLWLRYLPGLVAATGGAALLWFAPERRKIPFAVLATLLGLTSMEAEYWVAHGFPESEVTFFAGTVVVTLLALALGKFGGLVLGIIGLAFFAYVNVRYGAPYLLDYVLPVFYGILLALATRELKWFRSGVLAVGCPEAIWLILVNGVTIWRTSVLDKWGWLTGRPW